MLKPSLGLSYLKDGAVLKTEISPKEEHRTLDCFVHPISILEDLNFVVSCVIQYIEDTYIRLGTERFPVESDRNSDRCIFYGRKIPDISISDYIRRICQYSNFEPLIILSILDYAERLDGHSTPAKLAINLGTIHRFLISSICLSSKSHGDSFYSNSYYAKVGGISLPELNKLELELAKLLDWRLQSELTSLRTIWEKIRTGLSQT